MARDWTKAFRRAAFRGIGFETEAEDAAGARRLSISPIAYAETSVIEDMGREPREVTLTAYVAGDAADRRAIEFAAALDAPGAALLVLPMLGSLSARVRDWRLSRDLYRAGYVAFDVTFVEAGLGTAPFGPVAGAGPIASLMATGAAILGEALALALRRQPGSSAAGETQAATASAGRLAGVVTAASAGGVPAAAVAEVSAAMALAAAHVTTDPQAFAAAAVAGWRLTALHGAASTTAAAIRGELASEPEGVAGLVNSAAMAAALSVAAVRGDYPARHDAGRARAALAASVGPVIEASGQLGADTFGWLSAVTGDAALVLSRTAASRAPLVRVETAISLSSVRAAYELYGDANRAGELVERNRVATPAFMPASFEALAV